jgi:hypothetical protein
MYKWQNKMITGKKHNTITTVFWISRTENMAETLTSKDQIPHTIAKTTKTNAPEMIAADHPREIGFPLLLGGGVRMPASFLVFHRRVFRKV